MPAEKPLLTLGMAHFDDYDGAYFTIQSLRAHQGFAADELEILVVDNSPDSPAGRDLANLVRGLPNGRYVPFAEAVGTSAPRDRVFREAAADIVACTDCHVLFAPGSLRALVDWYQDQPDDCRDLVSGPMLGDDLGCYSTHFNAVWRAEMYGIWGNAWACPCRDAGDDRFDFSPLEAPDNGPISYRSLADQLPVVSAGCHHCDRPLPVTGWSGHDRALAEAGFIHLGSTHEPFEVPGMGLGFFSMRREAWPGFHPDARGFGGEELYIHAKVRAAGGKVWCHPDVRWIHRFGRPGGVRYPISREGKVRNYVLEWRELGRDLRDIHEHFVGSGWLSQTEWNKIVADPVNYKQPHQPPAAVPDHNPNLPPPGDNNLDTIFKWACDKQRDLHEHAAKLRELASQVSHITAVVKRREWDAFLLAGRPDDMVTYTTERDPLHDVLVGVINRTETSPRAPRRLKNYTVHAVADLASVETIGETDLLAIDSVHDGHRLHSELTRWASSVRRYIVMRGTQAFGELAEGGKGPGLLVALRRWCREYPEWSVVYHAANQYGLTVISRDERDKPKLPGVIELAANFTKAMAEHVADGLKHVDHDEYQARLEACTICDQRTANRCAACGCFLHAKAALRSTECPLGRWG